MMKMVFTMKLGVAPYNLRATKALMPPTARTKILEAATSPAPLLDWVVVRLVVVVVVVVH